MDRGAWKAAVHGVAECWTWLSDFTFTFHFHTLEKEMATHSSVLAWRISGMGEPGGLSSMGLHRVRHKWSDLAAAAMQYCSLQHWALLSSHYIHNWVLSLLQLCLFILFGVISPLISHSVLSTYWPGEFIFQCPIFLPFHPVHGVLKARILKWFAIPFTSGPCFVRTVHNHWSILGGPTWPGS